MSSETESKLLELGKWAIRSVQMIGYLPLSIRTRNSIRNQNSSKYFSFGPFYSPTILLSLTLLILTLGWETNFFNQVPSYQRYIALFGPTEKTVHFFYVLTASFMGVCFRVSGLLLGPQTIKFWQDLCQTLDQVQGRLGYYHNFKESMLDPEISWEFGQLQKTLRFSVLSNLVFILLHIFLVHGYRLYRTLTDDTRYWSEDSDFHLGSGFWFSLVLFHVINSIWLSFLVGIYTASFRCVAKKIRNLKTGNGDAKIMHEPGDIYCSELFQILKPLKIMDNGLNNQSSSNLYQMENSVGNYISAFILLEQLVARFNAFFGSQLIAEMFVCICNVVVHSFFLLLWIGRNVWRQVAMIIVPFLVFATHLYRLGAMGGDMTSAAEDVGSALFEKIPIGQLSPDLRFKVQILSSRIIAAPPIISGRKFFVVNRHLVTSVLSAITTFLVVLVQFRDSDNTKAGFPRRNYNNPLNWTSSNSTKT